MDEIKFDGNKLFNIRKEKGLSQEKLASLIGVSRQTIYLWESNQSLPDVEKVGRICKVLEIQLSDLVDGVNIKNNVDNNVIEKSIKKDLKKKMLIRKIVLLTVLISVLIYIVFSTIKFLRLNNILNKWKKLDEVSTYYIKIHEYLVDKSDNNNSAKNLFYEKYYRNGILKIVVKDSENKNVEYISICDYNTGNRFIVDENKKKYTKEKLDEDNESLKLTDNFKKDLRFSNNAFSNYIFCLNPNFSISYNELYKLNLNKIIQKNIDKETGILKSEETLDSSLRKTRRHYEVEINTDKDFEINLDEYTEVNE